MTVCIAAIRRYGGPEEIVAVADMMVSSGWTSGDNRAVKVARIAKRWVAMFAGSVSSFSPIVDNILDTMPDDMGEQMDAQAVAAICVRAFHKRRREIAENSILSAYGLTLDKFISKGREFLGDVTFDGVRRQLEDVRIGIEMLVFGYDSGKSPNIPRIFSIEDLADSIHPCLPEYHDKVGFHAIGSGSIIAQGNLLSTLTGFPSLDEFTYLTCQAKFLAEAAPGVGRETFVLIFDENGKGVTISPNGIDEIKKVWAKNSRPKTPKRAIDVTREAINESEGRYSKKKGAQ